MTVVSSLVGVPAFARGALRKSQNGRWRSAGPQSPEYFRKTIILLNRALYKTHGLRS